MRNFLLVLSVFLIAACGGSSQTGETSSAKLDDGHYEYVYVSGKDSSFLSIDVKGEAVTGAYRFIPEVSDGAVGDLKASQKDGIIHGSLNFTVEGYSSSEETYFDIKEDGLYWRRYQLTEDPQTQTMKCDTSKLVDSQHYVPVK